MGLFGKELALNRPLRKASQRRHLDLYSLCILDMCSADDQAHASVRPEFASTHLLSTMLGKEANISTTMADGMQNGPTDPSNPVYIMKPLAYQLPNEICKMLEKRA